jgi:hypothetical protein
VSISKAGDGEDLVDDDAVGRRRQCQWPPLPDPPHGVRGAGDERQHAIVALEQLLDDLVDDPVRGHIDPESVPEVRRPFGRAHPLHRSRGLLAPRAVVVGHDLPTGFVPQLLGLEEHAVEVEDHGADHRTGHRRRRNTTRLTV